MICKKCGIVVKNLARHLTRERCKAQHHRDKDGGYRPTGVKGTGGNHGERD